MAKFIVSNVLGETSDGNTIQSAATWFNSQSAGVHEIIVLGGTYSEGSTTGIVFNSGTTKTLHFYWLKGATMDGNNTIQRGIRLMYSAPHIYYIYGLNIKNYTQYTIFGGWSDNIGSYAGMDARFYKCTIKGKVYTERGRQVLFDNCTLSHGGIDWTTNGNCSVLGFTTAKQCLFYNMSPVMPFNTWSDTQAIRNFENNAFINSDIVINVTGWNTYRTTTVGSRLRNKSFLFKNCRFKAVQDSSGNPNTLGLSWVSCNNLSELNEYIASRNLVPAIQILDTEVEFRTDYEVDNYLFSITENNYIKMRRNGSLSYAKTALVSNNDYIENSNFTKVSDYLIRNTTDSSTITFLINNNISTKIKRFILNLDRVFTQSDEIIGTENCDFTVETSLDGITYNAPIVVKTNLVEITENIYNYGLLDNIFAKSAKVNVTLSGTNIGTKLKSVTMECLSLEEIVPQTTGRLYRKQLAEEGSGNLITDLPYSIQTPIGIFSGTQLKNNTTYTKIYQDEITKTNIVEVNFNMIIDLNQKPYLHMKSKVPAILSKNVFLTEQDNITIYTKDFQFITKFSAYLTICVDTSTPITDNFIFKYYDNSNILHTVILNDIVISNSTDVFDTLIDILDSLVADVRRTIMVHSGTANVAVYIASTKDIYIQHSAIGIQKDIVRNTDNSNITVLRNGSEFEIGQTFYATLDKNKHTDVQNLEYTLINSTYNEKIKTINALYIKHVFLKEGTYTLIVRYNDIYNEIIKKEIIYNGIAIVN